MVRMDWFISNFIGGVKLKVNPEDSEAATAILNQPIPNSFEVEGIGEYQQPHCPQCRSLDTAFEELNKPLAYASAYLRVPIPLHSKLWKCKACGYEWEDVVPVQPS
jgi:rubredoxin